ncbi:hypothetical protein ACC817_04055 [Rhizobium ruizarguesonis]|uniref:hypothetical protein n=1 Tax=Rhizobium ruizarguesonis TaxID=2081791 RepID=UPI00102FAFE9|nr:hypothetical protein [Rhizobium ruizarguesonis]TAY73720.1 hypothetical protein ELH84_07410 [Rhizobium ruizarguesonis]
MTAERQARIHSFLSPLQDAFTVNRVRSPARHLESLKTTFPGMAAAIHHSHASIYPDVFAKALLNPRFNETAATAPFEARPGIRFRPSTTVIKL